MQLFPKIGSFVRITDAKESAPLPLELRELSELTQLVEWFNSKGRNRFEVTKHLPDSAQVELKGKPMGRFNVHIAYVEQV